MKLKINFLYIILVLLLLFLCLKFQNIYNIFLKKVFFKEDKIIIFKDQFTSSYIESLENELKKYKNIDNIECINASVMYRNPIYWYDEIIINKGLNSNIKTGNYVLTVDGIIGTINKVENNTSTVLLITNINHENEITVGIKNGDEFVYGILNEYDKFNNNFIVSELTSDVNIGSIVVTTNFTSYYKEGLMIGEVIKVLNDKNGLSKFALVKPAVDYNNIRQVCITN